LLFGARIPLLNCQKYLCARSGWL